MARRTELIIVVLIVFALFCSCDLFADRGSSGKVYILTYGNSLVGNTASLQGLPSIANNAKYSAECFKNLAAYCGKTVASCVSLCGNMQGDLTLSTAATIENLKKNLKAVKNAATSEDLIIVVVSSHGDNTVTEKISYSESEDSKIIFATEDNSYNANLCYTYVSDLYDAVDSLPGTKLLICDFCYSGSIVEPDEVSIDRRLYNNSSALKILFDGKDPNESSSMFCLASSQYYSESVTYVYKFSLMVEAMLKGLGCSWTESGTGIANFSCSSNVQAKLGKYVTLDTIYNYVCDNGGEYNDYVDGEKIHCYPVRSGGSNDLLLFTLP